MFVYKVDSAAHFNAVELGKHGRNRTNVWDYPSVNSMAGSRREDLALHPTVKPVAIVAVVIPGSVGSALDALGMAQKLNRYSEKASYQLIPWIVEAGLNPSVRVNSPPRNSASSSMQLDRLARCTGPTGGAFLGELLTSVFDPLRTLGELAPAT